MVLFFVLVFLVNLPYAHETWTDHRVAEHGHVVNAAVIDAKPINGSYLVDYRLPRADDRSRTRYSASVDEPTYELAQRAHLIPVRMLAGDPGSNRPLGLVPSSLFKIMAIAADSVLVVIAGLYLYRRRHPDVLLGPRPLA